jgi:cell division protein FtsZ
VLDPDMQDEVRVTVVATGLNRNAARQPVGRGSDLREPMRAPIKLVRDATTGMAIDDGFAVDPISAATSGMGLRRGSAAPASSAPVSAPISADLPPDYLDIPAFLRRQAD